MNLLFALFLLSQTSQPGQTVAPAQRAGALAFSVIPGLVWPGAGHFWAGDSEGAKRLTWWGAAGLGLAGVGGLAIAATNSSRHAAWFPVSALWLGATSFLAAKLADSYGVGFGGRTAHAAPTPLWEVRAGLLWADDALAADHGFAQLGADLHWRAWHAALETEAAPSGDDRRFRLHLGRRFGLPPVRSGDGSFWEAGLAVAEWRFGADPVRLTTFEARLTHRRDLKRVHPTLSGSFVQADLGFGLEFAGYPGLQTFGDREVSRLALGSLATGVYLGHGAGEVAFFYDHRHDTRAGGLQLRVSGDGPAGAVGLRGRHRVTDGWSLTWDVTRGAHWVVGLGLTWQGGAK